MATGHRTIDLGVMDRGDGDREGQPWHVRRRRLAPRLRWRRPAVRRWTPALLVVLVALPLAAGSPAPDPELALVWTEDSLSLTGTGPWSRPVPGDTHLYTLRAAGDGVGLSAYRLATGRVEWRTPVPAGEVSGLVVVDGVPIVVDGAPRLWAYHPDTGQLLWRRPGVPGREVAGLLLVRAEAAGGDGAEVVTALDPRTGTVAGAVTERADRVAAPWLAPDGRLYLFTLGRDGVLARRPFGGGGTATTTTPIREPATGPRRQSLTTVAGLVMVMDRAGDRGVTAYDAGALRRRWTVAAGYQAFDCAPVVCVRVAGEPEPYGAVHGVDPRTGLIRWSESCADAGYGGAPCTLSVRQVGDGQLWTELAVPDRYTHGTLVTSWVMDAATGQRRTAPAPWSLAERYGDSGLLVSRTDRSRAAGPVVRPRRLWWGRTVPAGGVEVIGPVDATACHPRHPYLVCGTPAGGVAVWRVRG